MYQGLRTLAVVPARGGSKGIPRKNLSLVGGRTLIAHVADLVAELDWLDEAVLSTDDPEIADESTRVGLRVVDRPGELATDLASSVAAWRHSWLESEERSQNRYDLGVLLQPTSPLREANDVTECARVLVQENRAAVITVSPTPGHFTPEKTMVVREGDLVPYLGTGFEPIRQRIPDYYTLNGYCYAATRRRIVEEQRIHGDNTGFVVVGRTVVNIDEPFDIELANWLSEITGR